MDKIRPKEPKTEAQFALPPEVLAKRPRRYGYFKLRNQLIALNAVGLTLFLVIFILVAVRSESLVDAHRKTAIAQAQAIAHALAHSALQAAREQTGEGDMAPRIGTVQRADVTETVLALVEREHMRVVVYDTHLEPVGDSERIFDEIETRELGEIGETESQSDPIGTFVRHVRNLMDRVYLLDPWLRRPDLEQQFVDSLLLADSGEENEYIDWWSNDRRTLNAFAPIQPVKTVVGVVHLQEYRIDGTILAVQITFMSVALGSVLVTILTLAFLGGFIARPIRKLAAGADAITLGADEFAKIPDYSDRKDEIGGLSDALLSMTSALNERIESNARFAADVAHEIKNPLTSLRSAVETFQLAKTDEIREKLISVITSDVGRIDRLISDIANAGRVEAEMARENRRKIDVDELLSGIVDFYDATRSDSGVQLTYKKSRDEDRLFILGRQSKLGQVFRNLIDNALSFVGEEGRVTLTASRTVRDGRPWVRVDVEDNGPGIPAENLESIFERFYTERPSGETFGQHSGLGLSICRQIVEGHDGIIRAENITNEAGEQTGARFVVILPSVSA